MIKLNDGEFHLITMSGNSKFMEINVDGEPSDEFEFVDGVLRLKK